jgi:hypothetical protein
MRERWNLDTLSRKCSSYWQSLVRFGLPVAVLYGVAEYASFSFTRTAGMRYPWRVELASDVALMLVASAIWWGLMRQLRSWKRKHHGENG